MRKIEQNPRQREIDADSLFNEFKGRVSREEIERIYDQVWQDLARNATVIDFLYLLSKKESREILRKGKKTKKEA